MPTPKPLRKTLLIIVGIVAGILLLLFALKNKPGPKITPKLSSDFSLIPQYPNTQEVSFSKQNSLLSVTYEAEFGVDPDEILDFYEKNLKQLGWQIDIQDENQIQAQFKDGTVFRIWIYFTGGEDSGAMYNLDYAPQGAESLMPLPNQ